MLCCCGNFTQAEHFLFFNRTFPVSKCVHCGIILFDHLTKSAEIPLKSVIKCGGRKRRDETDQDGSAVGSPPGRPMTDGLISAPEVGVVVVGVVGGVLTGKIY